ncbi:MAG: DUF2225 domain-containing protein [Chloroflexi bacterium]|nr:DUF2225 domain-containing protein [Chloroflexota bacterium]
MSKTFPESEFIAKPLSCPACSAKFKALQVRTTAIRPRRQESDFYTEYDGPNPAHYTVWVCPHCKYASYRYDFRELTGRARINIRADAAKRKEAFADYEFQGIRDLATTHASYELAGRCYRIRKSRIAMQAALYLHRAWLAREQHLEEEEKNYLELARDHYTQSYAKEKARTEKDEIRQCYFIGDLSLRLGLYKEAVRWFQEVTTHPAIGEYPGLARRARERWADAREESEKSRKSLSANS